MQRHCTPAKPRAERLPLAYFYGFPVVWLADTIGVGHCPGEGCQPMDERMRRIEEQHAHRVRPVRFTSRLCDFHAAQMKHSVEKAA